MQYDGDAMNSKKPHILIIDDDKEIISLVSSYLMANGYRVTSAYNGAHLGALFRDNQFDMVILDVMLPGQNGLELCKIIRERHDVPILMLSAANSTADRVVGLELGADDYMNKPFSSRELLARIKAQLRRAQGELPNAKNRLPSLGRLRFAHWQLDRETHCLIDQEGVAFALSQREFDILLILLEHPNRIVSRAQLMDLLYDKEFNPLDRSIDVLMGRLRKKIEVDPKNPTLLITVRGGGYQLQSHVDKL